MQPAFSARWHLSGIPGTCQKRGLRSAIPTAARDQPRMRSARATLLSGEDPSGHARSLAAIPFRLNGEVVGVITLGSDEPDAFLKAEDDQFALLGSALTSALDLLDKKTLRRHAGKGSHGSWERTRFLADGLETASIPFAVIFPDGTTGAVNAALCRFLGYTEEELLALRLTGLFSAKDAAADACRHVLATQVPGRFESALRAKERNGNPGRGLFAVNDR